MIPTIEWLKQQDVTGLSQFTMDWVEQVIDDYQMMADENMLPDDEAASGAIAYDAENVLAIMRPDLPDVEFFERVIAWARLSTPYAN